MPKLPEFDAGRGQLTPNPQAEEAALRAGRMKGAFFHQLGESVKQTIDTAEEHQTQQELSHGLASGTTLENNGDQAWSAFTADPANKGRPDLANTFRDHYDAQVDEWAGQFKTDRGKMWAAERAATMKREMFQRTAADQSHLDAGVQIDNLQTTENNLAARIGRDPSSYDGAMGTWRDSIDVAISQNANIKPDDRARIEEELGRQGATHLTQAYYQGAINSVREQYATGATSSDAETQLRKDLAGQRGFEHLSPEEQTTLPERLDQAIRQGQEQAKSAVTLAQKQNDDEGRAVHAQLAVQVTQAQAAGKPIPPDVQQSIYAAAQKYPRLAGDYDSLLRAIPESQRASESGTYVQSDPKTEDAFNKRVLIPAGQPGALTVSEIIQAQNEKRLSPDVASRLLSQQEKLGRDPDLKQGYSDLDHFLTTAIRPQLTKSAPLDASGNPTQLGTFGMGGGPDLNGDIAYQEAVREAHEIFEGWLRAGKTPGEAVEIMSNPANNRSFYQRLPYFQNARHSPDAGAYFRAHQYSTTNDNPSPAASAPAVSSTAIQPRQAGESPEAYLRRTGG